MTSWLLVCYQQSSEQDSQLQAYRPVEHRSESCLPLCGSTGCSGLRGRLRGAMRPGSFTTCTQHIRRHPRSHRTRRLCCIRSLVRSIRAAGMAPQEMVSRRRKASAGESTCIHRGAPPATHLLGSSPRPACGIRPRPARSAAPWSPADTIAASPRTGCPRPHGQKEHHHEERNLEPPSQRRPLGR